MCVGQLNKRITNIGWVDHNNAVLTEVQQENAQLKQDIKHRRHENWHLKKTVKGKENIIKHMNEQNLYVLLNEETRECIPLIVPTGATPKRKKPLITKETPIIRACWRPLISIDQTKEVSKKLKPTFIKESTEFIETYNKNIKLQNTLDKLNNKPSIEILKIKNKILNELIKRINQRNLGRLMENEKCYQHI